MVAACDISRDNGDLGGLTDEQSVQPFNALSDADRQKFCTYLEYRLSARYTDEEIRRGVCLRSGWYSASHASYNAPGTPLTRCEQRYHECIEETSEEKANAPEVTYTFCEENPSSTCDISPATIDNCVSVGFETIREVAEIGTCKALLSGDSMVEAASTINEACDPMDEHCYKINVGPQTNTRRKQGTLRAALDI